MKHHNAVEEMAHKWLKWLISPVHALEMKGVAKEPKGPCIVSLMP